ncbi:protein extra-macrochaetae [Drosophila innubila]|uniref:protein extra-macrochaetae n=1 Tax=Drosophila innubila TaxID=198719 RepID=UPI00148D591F|nr:protein extra-macrochaetae [Drosophila innubila]
MKSLTAVCQTGASMPAMNPNGRISRHPPHRGDGENAEMKMYLSKLKDLVPFMPKNRKLSKLEIIQHVIDYICDLQTELETHPEINNFDAAAALSGVAAAAAAGGDIDDDSDEMEMEMEMNLNAGGDVLAMRLAAEQEQLAKISSPAAAARLPLIDRQSPNTILPAAALALASAAAAAAASAAATATTAPVQQQQQQQQLSDSLTTQISGEKDSRQS